VLAVDHKLAAGYEGAPYYWAKNYLTTLTSKLNIDVMLLPMPDKTELDVNAQMVAMLAKERSAIVLNANDRELIGVIGEFKEKVKTALKLPVFTAGFELDIAKLVASHQSNYKPIPRFPTVEQDITLKVKSDISYAQINELVNKEFEKSQPDNSQYKLEPIDIYQPDEEFKHYTFRLTIASFSETLKSKDINDLLDNVAIEAGKQLGATRL
jgi:phenylalanyl-tRNA synthetase beta subunit